MDSISFFYFTIFNENGETRFRGLNAINEQLRSRRRQYSGYSFPGGIPMVRIYRENLAGDRC